MFARFVMAVIALLGAAYPGIYAFSQRRANKKAAVVAGLFCAAVLTVGIACLLLY